MTASPSRRDPVADPACGGLAYAHIQYDEQLRLKGEIVADAFRRQARHVIDQPPAVAPSPEAGYRLRARLHVRDRRAGFFLEGTHTLCDAASTQQLLPASTSAIDAWLTTLGDGADAIDALTVVENIAASERVLHIEARPGADVDGFTGVPTGDGVSGVTAESGRRVVRVAGARSVSDTAADLFVGESPIDPQVTWRRRGTSFFQGNRFLIGALVRRVLAAARGDRVVDLYAGVGLFAVALAASGARVLAVEGGASSGADLEANARPFRDRLRVERAPVEAVVTVRMDPPPDTVVVDPPRTGLSPAALGGVVGWRPSRIVYVSCDPPTLARDAARLAEAGYSLSSVDCLDLFPNTAHVETVAVFEKGVTS
jgi:23S rRNA (uracil1939-C5)-methyltransferase